MSFLLLILPLNGRDDVGLKPPERVQPRALMGVAEGFTAGLDLQAAFLESELLVTIFHVPDSPCREIQLMNVTTIACTKLQNSSENQSFSGDPATSDQVKLSGLELAMDEDSKVFCENISRQNETLVMHASCMNHTSTCGSCHRLLSSLNFSNLFYPGTPSLQGLYTSNTYYARF